MKTTFRISILFISLFSIIQKGYSQDIGATFCWHYAEIYGGHGAPGFPGNAYPYNKSIVTNNLPTTSTGTMAKWEGMDQWWENMVEEVDYSGIDFVALLSRGSQPNQTKDLGTGDVKHIPTMVKYMKDRDAKFKLAIFDDCPNSWTSSRNYDLYGKDETKYELFDCGNPDNYKYIWDYNLKIALESIPDNMRYKIDNRPVIYFWSVKDTWMTNIQGNLSKIITHIKTECQKSFGFVPYIIVMQPWFDRDTTLTPSQVDAAHNWFSAAGGTSFTLNTINNIKAGVCVPSFVKPSEPQNGTLLPGMGTTDQGTRLKYGLDNTVKAGAMVTLVEGFTDSAEGAALWRSNDNVYYNYPNQRLNILRRYTKNPYPAILKAEVEACDSHNDLTIGNSGGSFLKEGNLDVVKCTDQYGGWFVTNTQATEWMEWQEMPLLKNTKFQLRYKSTATADIKFSVDGSDLATITLPSTSGIWATIDAGNYSNSSNSLHTVRLTIVSGTPDINYFTRVNSGNVAVTGVRVTPDTATLSVGYTQQLTATVLPTNASNETVTWTTSNAAVATVNASGLVTGIATGTATIIATSEDEAKTASSNITVTVPTTTTLQAEDAILSGAIVATNQLGYNGTGFADFTNASNDFIKWTFNAPTAGSYDLSFRYAVPSSGRSLQLKINGTVAIASLNFPGTGAWTTWQNVKTTQTLNTGSNEIMLTTIGLNGGNFDELVITDHSNLGVTDLTNNLNEKSVNIYPNPYKEGTLSIDLIGFESMNDAKVKIINLLGQTIYQTSISNSSHAELNLTNKLTDSIYLVSIEAGNTHIIKKLIIK